jgi:flagellar biosynthesis protein FlhB
MSKQEVKEEHKSNEGRPEVRSASASSSSSWRGAT